MNYFSPLLFLKLIFCFSNIHATFESHLSSLTTQTVYDLLLEPQQSNLEIDQTIIEKGSLACIEIFKKHQKMHKYWKKAIIKYKPPIKQTNVKILLADLTQNNKFKDLFKTLFEWRKNNIEPGLQCRFLTKNQNQEHGQLNKLCEFIKNTYIAKQQKQTHQDIDCSNNDNTCGQDKDIKLFIERVIEDLCLCHLLTFIKKIEEKELETEQDMCFDFQTYDLWEESLELWEETLALWEETLWSNQDVKNLAEQFIPLATYVWGQRFESHFEQPKNRMYRFCIGEFLLMSITLMRYLYKKTQDPQDKNIHWITEHFKDWRDIQESDDDLETENPDTNNNDDIDNDEIDNDDIATEKDIYTEPAASVAESKKAGPRTLACRDSEELEHIIPTSCPSKNIQNTSFETKNNPHSLNTDTESLASVANKIPQQDIQGVTIQNQKNRPNVTKRKRQNIFRKKRRWFVLKKTKNKNKRKSRIRKARHKQISEKKKSV